jgi:TolB protein
MNAQPNAAYEVIADPGFPWKFAGGARWSPDGTHIAYIASTFNPPEPTVSKMFLVAPTGGTSELIAGDGTWSIGGLDWSPDGSQIVYSSNQDGTYHLWIMPSTGGSPTQLTAGPGEGNPSWSPDGTKIAYLSNAARQIWIVYSTGENPTQVTFDQSVLTPAWSPDGTAIAFTVYIGDVSNIWSLAVK